MKLGDVTWTRRDLHPTSYWVPQKELLLEEFFLFVIKLYHQSKNGSWYVTCVLWLQYAKSVPDWSWLDKEQDFL